MKTKTLVIGGVVIAILVVVGVILVSRTTVIDNKKAETFIRDSVKEAGGTVTSISCPEDVEAKAKTTFNCKLSLSDGSSGTVTMHIIDDDGNIVVSPSDFHLK